MIAHMIGSQEFARAHHFRERNPKIGEIDRLNAASIGCVRQDAMERSGRRRDLCPDLLRRQISGGLWFHATALPERFPLPP